MNGPESVPPPEDNFDDESSTVELVEFGPTAVMEGPVPPSIADAATYARRRRLRWIVGLSLAAFVAFLILVGPPCYRQVKNWRADALARKAESFLAQGQVEEAIPTVRAAFQLSPDEPEVVRAMAQTLSALNLPGAMNYWHWVLVSKGATDQDRRDAAEFALQQGMYADAAQIINGLSALDVQNLLMAGRLYALSGDSVRALGYATQATLLDPTFKPALIFRAVQELKNRDLHAHGIQTLLQLADSDDIYGLLALQRVAGEPGLRPDELDHVLHRLRTHPLAGEIQRETLLALEIRQEPARRTALIDAAMAAHQTASQADRHQFARWLESAGDPARVLQLITLPEALADQTLFLPYIDAMSALHKFADLRDLLLHHKVPLDPSMVQLYLSRCAHALGDPQAEDLYWRGAQIAALHNPKQTVYLAMYAEKLGQRDRAEPIYRLLTQEPLVARAAFLGLLRLQSPQDTKAQRDILDQMAGRWPNDPSILGDDTYLNILLKSHPKEMGARVAALLQAEPGNLSYRASAALLLLRQGDEETALKIFRQSQIDWTHAPASVTVIYAAVLQANGQHRSAHRALAPLDLDRLRPEERALVKSIR